MRRAASFLVRRIRITKRVHASRNCGGRRDVTELTHRVSLSALTRTAHCRGLERRIFKIGQPLLFQSGTRTGQRRGNARIQRRIRASTNLALQAAANSPTQSISVYTAYTQERRIDHAACATHTNFGSAHQCVDLSRYRVGDVLLLPEAVAAMLIRENYAELASDPRRAQDPSGRMAAG